MTKIFPISRFTVNGNSMLPLLHPGQDILSFNWAYLSKKPKVGDVVVVKVDGKDMVKHIQTIRDREVFVVGDNIDESTDSRNFGAVGMDQIVGKVIFYTENHPERAERSNLKKDCHTPPMAGLAMTSLGNLNTHQICLFLYLLNPHQV